MDLYPNVVTIVANPDIVSDESANLSTWKSIHSDWNKLYKAQFDMPDAKYLAKCKSVHEDISLYF